MLTCVVVPWPTRNSRFKAEEEKEEKKKGPKKKKEKVKKALIKTQDGNVRRLKHLYCYLLHANPSLPV